MTVSQSRSNTIGPLFPDYKPRRDSDPWDNPPSLKAILDVGPEFTDRIKKTVTQEQKKAKHSEAIKNHAGYAGRPAKFWGWKDGRIGLIIPIVAPFLENPHYVFIRRDVEETAQAITRRQKIAGYPIPLSHSRRHVQEYHSRITSFLS